MAALDWWQRWNIDSFSFRAFASSLEHSRAFQNALHLDHFSPDIWVWCGTIEVSITLMKLWSKWGKLQILYADFVSNQPIVSHLTHIHCSFPGDCGNYIHGGGSLLIMNANQLRQFPRHQTILHDWSLNALIILTVDPRLWVLFKVSPGIKVLFTVGLGIKVWIKVSPVIWGLFISPAVKPVFIPDNRFVGCASSVVSWGACQWLIFNLAFA